jgi:pimeloyl-ACP methyl ester carboxylesterase
MTDKIENYTLQGVEVEVARKGEGAPLLLLHGGGGPIINQPFTDELAKKFEIIAPTHPGFGGTKAPDHFDGMQDLIYLHLDLLDALEIDGAVLMGMSMGGWVAAELATISSARFSQLILVDAVGVKIGGPTDRDVVDVWGIPPEQATRLMWHDPNKAPKMEGLSDEAIAGIAANRIALALYTWEPYMHNPKLRHRLHRISLPTLVIWGASDGLVKPEYGEAYAKLIDGAKFVVIPEAGHSPHAEQPEAFVSQVLAFTD